MKYETASSVVQLLLRHANEQDELLRSIQIIQPEEDFERVRSMIANTMGAIYLDALNPLFDEFPDLKPIRFR